MTNLSLLADIAWKGSFILAAAFVVAPFLRRASAAARHLLWAEALAAVVLLPVLVAIVPHWNSGRTFAVRPAVQNEHARTTTSDPRIVPPVSLGPSLVLWLWLLGCAVVATRFVRGVLRTTSIVRRAKLADYAKTIANEIAGVQGMHRAVAVLESSELPIPFAWGILRPTIVLPEAAAGWPEARIRGVLWHELTHVRRHDVLAQAVAQIACSLYWFQPLVWLAARRLRQEREFACDDVVLTAGVAPQEYAADLVNLARGMATRKRAWADAPAMADGRDLETRVRALFDESRNRRPVSLWNARAIKLAVLAALLPVASVVVQAQADLGSVTGVVVDPSGARVPNARVTADHAGGTNKETTRCNMAGEYHFNAIPSGAYVLEFASAGFAPARVNTVVKAGAAARVDATLEMGSVTEAMMVAGQKLFTASSNGTSAHLQIPVGGNVQPLKLTHQVRPEYPADLQRLGVQGSVMIRAVISVNGDVLSPEVISAGVDARLKQLALDAVKQWRYEPSLLNGEPVETATTVTIEFALDSVGQ